MGLFKRAAERSSDKLWSSLPPLGILEERVDYAHVVMALDEGDRRGTAFLTNQRLFWQQPDGRSVSFDLADCVGFSIRDDRPGQSGIAPVFHLPGEGEAFRMSLYPQNSGKANRLLAADFVQAVARELLEHHPEWKKEPPS